MTGESRLANVRWRDVQFEGLRSLLLLFIIGVSLLPIVYITLSSFKPPDEFFLPGLHWFPQEPTIDAWVQAFNVLRDPLITSSIVASGTTVIALLITIPGAYVFGRREFPGRKFIFYSIVISLLFPYIILIIPIADIWNDIGLYNTIPGIWLAYQVFVAPFAIWLLRDFFASLPTNIEEAAQVYGCTPFGAFFRVVLPLSAPGVMAVMFMAFLISWNDFLFANMILQANKQTAIVALFKSTQGGERTYWGMLMAEALIIGIPPTVLYMIARKKLTNAFAV